MIKLDPWSIGFTIFNLLIFAWIMKKFLFQPVMNVINKRNDLIEEQFANASASQKEADDMKQEYTTKLQDAQKEALQIVANAKDTARSEQNEILQQAQNDAAMMKQKAQEDIKLQQAKAEDEVKEQIASLAMSAARKIIKTGESNDQHSN